MPNVWRQEYEEYIAEEEDVKEHIFISEEKPPANPPSKELLPISASEIEQQILSSSLTKIAKGQERYLHEQDQKKIQEHYEQRAEKLLKKIWKECKKRTKHSDRRLLSDRNFQCRTCGVSLWRDEYGKLKTTKGAATVAVNEVAQKLRAADVEAGIEWIP